MTKQNNFLSPLSHRVTWSTLSCFMVTMETKPSKWEWSNILFRWLTSWCFWARIFSASSLCLGRKNTFSIFVPLEFINLVSHICLKFFKLWMFHVTFWHLSSDACLDVRMLTSTVFFRLWHFSPYSCSITHEQRLVKSSGQNDQYPFGWRVFSAWDFLITERETADNKVASLTTGIKVGRRYNQLYSNAPLRGNGSEVGLSQYFIEITCFAAQFEILFCASSSSFPLVTYTVS